MQNFLQKRQQSTLNNRKKNIENILSQSRDNLLDIPDNQTQAELMKNDIFQNIKPEIEKNLQKQEEQEQEIREINITQKLTEQLQYAHRQVDKVKNLEVIPSNKAQEKEVLLQINNLISNTSKQEQDEQLVDHICDIQVNLRNYKQIVKKIFESLEHVHPQLYQKFLKVYLPLPKNKSRSGVDARLTAALNSYQSYRPALEWYAQKRLKIEQEKRWMNEASQKWYRWYLKSMKVLPTTELYKKMNTPSIKQFEMKTRLNKLNQRVQDLKLNFKKYYNRNKRIRSEQLLKYTQLLQNKNNLFNQQKKTLGFLVIKKEKEINELEHQLEEKNEKYTKQRQQLIKQANLVIQQQIKKEKELTEHLNKLNTQNIKDEKKIKQQKEIIDQQQKIILNKQQQLDSKTKQAQTKHNQEKNVLQKNIQTKNKEKNDLNEQLNQIKIEYEKNIKILSNQMRQFQTMSQNSFNQMMNQRNNEILNLSQQYSNRVKGQEAQFKMYIQKLQQQLNSKKNDLQMALDALRKTDNYSKQRQNQLVNELQGIKKQTIQQKNRNNWILQSKDQEIEQRLKQINKQNQRKEEKYKKWEKQKEEQLNKLIEQNNKLKNQNTQMIQKVSHLSKLLENYDSQQVYSSKYLMWQNAANVTIRMCFKIKDKSNWIPTTRGIDIQPQFTPLFYELFAYWIKIKQTKTFPEFKTQRMVGKSNIMAILDHYKGKKYYSLRETYWNKGQIYPTRKGFNISEEDLNFFFGSIKNLTPKQDIQK